MPGYGPNLGPYPEVIASISCFKSYLSAWEIGHTAEQSSPLASLGERCASLSRNSLGHSTSP